MLQHFTSRVTFICGKVPEWVVWPWRIPLLFYGKASGRRAGGRGWVSTDTRGVCVCVCVRWESMFVCDNVILDACQVVWLWKFTFRIKATGNIMFLGTWTRNGGFTLTSRLPWQPRSHWRVNGGRLLSRPTCQYMSANVVLLGCASVTYQSFSFVISKLMFFCH